MLIVIFGLSFLSFSFITQYGYAIRNNEPFNGTAHAILIGACITFLVFYFT